MEPALPAASSSSSEASGIAHQSPARRAKRVKKPTTRASMACQACRKRRIRCEAPQGTTPCLACKHACKDCFFDQVDERTRPISRAYVHQLMSHFTLLQAAKVGPESSPPPTSVEGEMRPSIQSQSPSGSITNMSHGQITYPSTSEWLHRFDETTSRVLYSTASAPSSLLCESDQGTMAAEETLWLLAPQTQTYLVSLYWKFFNSVVPVIHREWFEKQQQNGTTSFSFHLLHICVMALGYRYADKSREDMQKMSQLNGESILHTNAKSLLAFELERLPSVPLVAALLLVGDLEWGAGRRKQAWLYGQMALRTSFDAGLHLPDHDQTWPTFHAELRRTTLSVCLVAEIYWTNFLESSRSTVTFGPDPDTFRILCDSCYPLLDCSPTDAREAQIYKELFKLMVLINQLPKITQSCKTQYGFVPCGLLPLMALKDEMLNWFRELPEGLGWSPGHFPSASFSFFLLHQQYHCALIHYHHTILNLVEETVSSSTSIQNLMRHIGEESRKSSTLHALSVSKIFQQHRKQYDTKHIFFIAVKHAQAAASVLIAAVDRAQSFKERNQLLTELRPLFAAITDMARTYQPAKGIALELRRHLAKTLNETDDVRNSPTEQSDTLSCQISPHGDSYASETPGFTTNANQTCGATTASNNGDLTLPAAFTAGDEVEITQATSSLHEDRHFPQPSCYATGDNGFFANDMSSKDHLHLALFYEPQLRDFGLF
ncbi:hypothetical protein IQ07DRAFT_644911 [Pyrenochaeta sp. DS3sAY3a]|nr:hypothetical protein IQ07DRAFT_644911 [Pyrenochaeta sp. DS3sAY3a]